jgi:hypothetical protein
MAPASSICAQRYAAFSSLGRSLEPHDPPTFSLSTPVPAEEAAAVGALLADDLGALGERASFTSRAPPSPRVMFLVSWKLRQPEVPDAPERPAAIRRHQALRRVLDHQQPSLARRCA